MKIQTRIKNIFIVTALALSISTPCCYSNIDDYFLQPRPHTSKKAELKKVLKKFGKAMVIVAISGISLFTILSITRRCNLKRNNINNVVELEKTLISPETIDDATKFVIEKF